MRIIAWIKTHKLTAVLTLIVVYFLSRSFFGLNFSPLNIPRSTSYDANVQMKTLPAVGGGQPMGIGGGGGDYYGEAPPAPEVKDRMIVKNSFLSLQVKKVNETLKVITDYTTSIGGYMVEANLSSPEEAPYASVTVRIPQEKLEGALSHFKSLSVKVISEQVSGYDVTDEYVDIEAKLTTLVANQKRFKEIMDQATKPDDILKIQQQIFDLQDQIDRLVGRQKYMEQTAKMAKATIYLSTDEFALPYAPSGSFRPEVIFKTAVRSLIVNLQKLAAFIIWILVYAPIWLPILILILYFIRKKRAAGKVV